MYELLLATGVFLWLAFFLYYARLPIASVFHPATYYLFFHGFIFVIRPIFAWYQDFQLVYVLYQFSPPMDVKITTLIAADIGFVAFMLTVLSVGKAPFNPRPTVGTIDDSQRRDRSSLLWATAICAPLGIASLLSNIRDKIADVNTQIIDASTGTSYNTDSIGYFTDASNMLGALGVLIAWQYRFRPIALLPFAGYALGRMMIGGGRWTFLLTTVALCALFLYDRRKRWFNGRTVLVVIPILVLFAFIGEQRDLIRSIITGIPSAGGGAFEYHYLEGMDFANLEYFEYLVWIIPEKTGTYGYFLDNLQIFTEPVPRILWSGKPVGAPIQLYKIFDYGTPIGMTMSLPGEGWSQLGYLGVILWCSLFGALWGHAYNWFMRSRQSVFQVAIFLLILPLTVQSFRDGTIVTLLKFPLFFLIPIGIWKLIAVLRASRTKPVPVPISGRMTDRRS